MAVQVEADALTSLTRVKRHLSMPDSETKRDEYLIDLINAAGAWIRRFTGGQPIRQRAIKWSDAGEGCLTGDGSNTLYLPARPLLACSYIHVDTRWGAGSNDWYWDVTNVEKGGLRYGPAKDFVIDHTLGKIVLLNGFTWPTEPVIRIEAVVGLADGTTAFPLPLNAAFPHSTAILGGNSSTSPYGGKFHQLYGWEQGAGEAVQQKADELVAWFFRQGERAQQGVMSRSGEGYSESFFDDVPKEIRQFFESWRGMPV